ncbi:MAG: nucleotidyltransferase domain-containing protein [Gemmatimonadales bacterium]|nr:MAG: nucleotidyltransferase domain-containing protein [Gemmatimonadales bacterium]
MLLNPLDHLLGTRTKVRLLRALVPLDRPVSGREAARLAGVSRIALKTLEDLGSAGILNQTEATGQHLYTFNRQHSLAPVFEELFKEERRFTAAIFDRLRQALEANGSVESAIVFGSTARGEAGPESDLDLLVIVRQQEAREDVHLVLTHLSAGLSSDFGVRLSPVVITLEQLRKQSEEGDPFIDEVRRDARRIMGPATPELTGG